MATHKAQLVQAEDEFRVGDVVVLRSGGASMTVESVDNDSVKCVWHDGRVVRERIFLAATLVEGDGTVETMLERLNEKEQMPKP